MSLKASTKAEVEQPRLEFTTVDPGSLIIGTNVRVDPQVEEDADLIGSIKDFGVLTPIVGCRNHDGSIEVVKGQRRTLAAVKAKRTSVPVMITESPDAARRLLEQLAENDHRLGLADSDRVTAYEQLAAIGMSAEDIARKARRPRPEIVAALKVAASPLARKATTRWEFLTLDQSAVLAEFDDDNEAAKQLVLAAQRGGFDHLAQRLRDERAERAERAAAAQALAAAGFTVIDQPRYDSSNRVARLEYLKQDDEVLTEANHRECPGHAAYLREEWVYPQDSEDGEGDTPDSSEHAEDEHDEGEDEDEAGTDEDDDDAVRTWVPVWVCTDPGTYGHVSRYGNSRDTERKTADQMTDAERETARAYRRDVINSNRAWISAETVRLAWVRPFLTRKTVPKGAAMFIAQALSHADHAITQALTGGNQVALDLLGIGEPKSTAMYRRVNTQLLEHLANTTEARAQMVTLGLLLAAYEDSTSKDSWRRRDPGTTRYLKFLQANGYTLSDVELRACGEKPADTTSAETAVDASVDAGAVVLADQTTDE